MPRMAGDGTRHASDQPAFWLVLMGSAGTWARRSRIGEADVTRNRSGAHPRERHAQPIASA